MARWMVEAASASAARSSSGEGWGGWTERGRLKCSFLILRESTRLTTSEHFDSRIYLCTSMYKAKGEVVDGLDTEKRWPAGWSGWWMEVGDERRCNGLSGNFFGRFLENRDAMPQRDVSWALAAATYRRATLMLGLGSDPHRTQGAGLANRFSEAAAGLPFRGPGRKYPINSYRSKIQRNQRA